VREASQQAVWSVEFFEQSRSSILQEFIMTIASIIGKSTANAAAYTVHGIKATGVGSVHFVADVRDAFSEQYAAKSAELTARREQLALERGAIAMPAAPRRQRKLATSR
jgi:hypothetical protein